MQPKLIFAVIASKLTIKILRLFKSGATTLPGKIALKICPDIAKHISKNFNIIMVTGTNGKTTTSRIIAGVLAQSGIDFISNKSGANLESGIITTFISAVNIKGTCSKSTALIEVDEAAFKKVSEHIKPNILVVTNFFRDQLDRYGELYTTLKNVKQGIEKSAKTRLILNADDSLCASLGKGCKNKVTYYGFDKNVYECAENITYSDAMFCIFCKEKYEYSGRVYSHLGQFKCKNCGYSRPHAHIICTKIKELSSSYSDIQFKIGKNTRKSKKAILFDAKINLPGIYNVYNALAAAACGMLLKLPANNITKALSSFECGFGRMETINSNGKKIKIVLVKNPTGFNQVLNLLLTEKNSINLAFLINDNAADGTDISWLWDVDFELLSVIKDKIKKIYTSGKRAEDMTVRLKYAGIFIDKITIIKDYNRLIDEGLKNTEEGQSLYILPTYTALLEIRKTLKKIFNLKEFWK